MVSGGWESTLGMVEISFFSAHWRAALANNTPTSTRRSMAGVSRGRSILKGDERPEKAREARAAGGGGGPHETMRWEILYKCDLSQCQEDPSKLPET
jgi:hypothetical protein